MGGAGVGLIVALQLFAVSTMDECAPPSGGAWTQQRLIHVTRSKEVRPKLKEAERSLDRVEPALAVGARTQVASGLHPAAAAQH